MQSTQETTYYNLLQCLAVISNEEYLSYVCRMGAVTDCDLVEISHTIVRETIKYKITMKTKDTTIASLKGELSSAHNSVVMFESAIADYKSNRRIY